MVNYTPIPIAEVRDHQRTDRVGARISPWLKRQVAAKQLETGVTLSDILRPCLKLWADGQLDDLFANVGQVD